ncbi:unnamed protein product [Lactuca virosa]|uniref:BED-type domain-containing protein n=1 Tax=Lactuca virosa TaxID=75947 RepID=A0AAU9MHM0_9ASTR|nr:unnamed protein product [Lactuca virosa]
MASNEGVINVDDQQDVGVQVPGEVDIEKKIKQDLSYGPLNGSIFHMLKAQHKSECTHCKKVLACGTKGNGTSSLLSHLVDSCRRSPGYEGKDKDAKKQTKLSFKSEGTEVGGPLAKHSFSQEKCRLALGKMCIKDNRPYIIVDDEGFKEFVWELNLEFQMTSRWTAARDCIEIYEQEAKKVKEMLKGQTVRLTIDTWSSV